MSQNERTYRQLHPRVVESERGGHVRFVLVVLLCMVCSSLFWLTIMALILLANTGPHV